MQTKWPNTAVIPRSDGFDVYLYSTRIISVIDGEATFEHGCWATPLTSRRMNQVCAELLTSCRVESSQGEWRLRCGNQIIPFVDGVAKVRLATRTSTPITEVKAVRRRRRLVLLHPQQED